MKRTNKIEKYLNEPSFELNKSKVGCAPCLDQVAKIDKQINGRSLNEIKINEIKKIVKSIFASSKNGT